MAAGLFNCTLEENASFARTFTWQNRDGSAIDITDASAELNIVTDEAAPVVVLAATTADYISIDGPAGKITVNVPPDVINYVVSSSGRYYMELRLTLAGGQVVPLVYGYPKLRKAA